MSSPPAEDIHEWVRRRLVAHATNLLDDDDARRFEDHVSECADCNAAVELTSSGEDDSQVGAHIPTAILARWEQACRDLDGLERAMVRRHLDRCARCRSALEAIGFEPEMTHAPEPGVGRAGPRADLPEERHRRSPSREGSGKIIERTRWLFGAWALAATAAVAVLMLRGPLPRESGGSLEPIAVAQLGMTRAGGEEAAVVRVRSGGASLGLVFNYPEEIPIGTMVTIEVLDPRGRVIQRDEGPIENYSAPNVVYVRGAEPLPAGRYSLRITPARAGFEPLLLEFLLQIRD